MKIKSLLLAFLLVLGMGRMDADAKPITIVDMTGRKVTVPLDPQRIVCLGPGTLRLIVYLQAEKKVVGVEAMEKNFPRGRPYWLAHPELQALPICGPGGAAAINKKPDLETLLKLAPQLIFVTYMDAALANEVQEVLGIPVVVLSYGAFSTFDEVVFDALRIAGASLDRSQRAETVIRMIDSWRRDLHRRTVGYPGNRRPQVYVGGIGYRSVQGIESTQQTYPPLDWVNADNLARRKKSHTGSHIFVEKEALLKLDPEVIFIDGGGMALVSENFAKQPQFYGALQAFSHRRVYVLHPFNWYVTNIDTALADAYAIGKVLYEDRFEDIDPQVKADEIYTELTGTPVYKKMEADYGPIGHLAPFFD